MKKEKGKPIATEEDAYHLINLIESRKKEDWQKALAILSMLPPKNDIYISKIKSHFKTTLDLSSNKQVNTVYAKLIQELRKYIT
jgi:hypothetical protein